MTKKHLKNVGPIRHCEPLHAACSNFTLPFTRCRYCRTPPLSHAACASMSTTTTTTTRDRGDHYMAPWNGPNDDVRMFDDGRWRRWGGWVWFRCWRDGQSKSFIPRPIESNQPRCHYWQQHRTATRHLLTYCSIGRLHSPVHASLAHSHAVGCVSLVLNISLLTARSYLSFVILNFIASVPSRVMRNS